MKIFFGLVSLVAVFFTGMAQSAPIEFKETGRAAGIADPNINSAGVGMADYDNDGDVDIYISNEDTGPNIFNRLWENDGQGHFVDVAALRGVQEPGGLGRGVSWGDYDNDGDKDLLVANMGSNRRPLDEEIATALYKNLLMETGEPNFENVTRQAGLMRDTIEEDAIVGGITGTGSGIAWADYNNDGYLDIFVRTSDDDIDNSLFKNNGDGTFTEVTKEAGVGILGKVLKADSQGNGAWLDVNLDGLVDLLVINEDDFNFLFLNKGDGTFDDISKNRQPPTAIAFYNTGTSDGTCVADIDNDGDMDVYLTHADQANRLIRNDFVETGEINFTDITFTSGAGHMGGARGCTMADFDNDGWVDIYVNNGGPSNELINDVMEGFSPFTQFYIPWSPGENVLLRNNGDNTFTDVTKGSGAKGYGIGSGVASGDVNNDGFPDIFVNNRTYYSGGKRANIKQRNWLFINKGNDNNWIKVKLVASKSNGSAYHTRVKVAAGDLTQTKESFSAQGYNSADDAMLIFGLGDRQRVDDIQVTWPSGEVQTLDDLAPGQTVTIIEPN